MCANFAHLSHIFAISREITGISNGHLGLRYYLLVNETEMRSRWAYSCYLVVLVVSCGQMLIPWEWASWLGWIALVAGGIATFSCGVRTDGIGSLVMLLVCYGLGYVWALMMRIAKGDMLEVRTATMMFMVGVSLLGMLETHSKVEIARADWEWECRLRRAEEETRKYAARYYSQFDAEAVDAGHTIAVAIEEDAANDDADNGHGRV